MRAWSLGTFDVKLFSTAIPVEKDKYEDPGLQAGLAVPRCSAGRGRERGRESETMVLGQDTFTCEAFTQCPK